MSIKLVGPSVIVLEDKMHPLWGLGYLVIAVALAWGSLASMNEPVVFYVGGAVAFYFGALGVKCLLPGKELLRLDTTTKLVHVVSHSWFGGRQTTTFPFADVLSIGTDTFKDPRDGAIWAVAAVLRLRDGRSVPAGTVHDVERIPGLAGLPLDHKVIVQEKPQVESA